ncbi:MAG: hypothetical protein IVW57_01630 [Ktedonobacterales bacterium]|nr:hypothetical protein [Ktedonobacterales bacterium]
MTREMALLWLAGAFTVVLGLLHFFLPAALDYRTTMLGPARERPAPRPLRLWPTRYVVTPGDRYAIIWVMNHAASYALVSIGLVDLLAARWLLTAEAGRLVALWIAGWWFLRAANQFLFGRRAGDWLILIGFALLGLIHLGAVWR